jgi:hypothetical protein
MACAIRSKYMRTHYNGATTIDPTAAAVLSKEPIKGAKELKKYTTELTTLLANIQSEFETDLSRPECNVNVRRICLKDHDARNEMCQVAHNDFVYAAVKLPQCSAFLQAKEAAQECLGQIELVRKMMVTNKQQKKTTIRKLRCVIAREKKAKLMLPALVIDKNPAIINHHLNSIALEDEDSSPTVKSLRSMISETKQNHRTVSKNLLKQAAALMDAMRNQHLLTYKVAAESTIGAIMSHASACSAFMRQTHHLAVIQFCASQWWNEYEKPALLQTTTTPHPPNNYYVVAELSSGLHAKFVVSHTSHYLSFLEENCPVPDIRVVVYADPVLNAVTKEYEQPVVCSYVFDDILAETILTDEAIEAFEEAQRQAQRHI